MKRLRQSIGDIRYGTLALELIVVVLGILIAFQIDRWAEERGDRSAEYEYLVRLKDDLQMEMQSFDRSTRRAESRISSILAIERAIANPSFAQNRNQLPAAVARAFWRTFPEIGAFVYTELQSTGNFTLIRSESLRRDLAGYYSQIQSATQVGTERYIQEQFDLLTAGMLTTAELIAIENNSWREIPEFFSEERAVEIIESLSNRPDAVALLPSIARQHVFTQEAANRARTRATAIIGQIDSLLEDFE
jgi:hypothetical protein